MLVYAPAGEHCALFGECRFDGGNCVQADCDLAPGRRDRYLRVLANRLTDCYVASGDDFNNRVLADRVADCYRTRSFETGMRPSLYPVRDRDAAIPAFEAYLGFAPNVGEGEVSFENFADDTVDRVRAEVGLREIRARVIWRIALAFEGAPSLAAKKGGDAKSAGRVAMWNRGRRVQRKVDCTTMLARHVKVSRLRNAMHVPLGTTRYSAAKLLFILEDANFPAWQFGACKDLATENIRVVVCNVPIRVGVNWQPTSRPELLVVQAMPVSALGHFKRGSQRAPSRRHFTNWHRELLES